VATRVEQCRTCDESKVQLPNRNCPGPGEDGLPVQCVGSWAKEKHDYLFRYIEATRAARAKYLSQSRGEHKGGAAYIDLFAGPGRARVRGRGEEIDGSPLIAVRHVGAPFSQLVLCELDSQNAEALRLRTLGREGVEVIEGDCHERIDDIVRLIPPQGLNFALIDPFSLDQLRFETIARLAAMTRMDLLIHFPTMDLKRNLTQGAGPKLSKAIGSEHWQSRIRKPEDVTRAIDELRAELAKHGYTGAQVRSVPIMNTKGGVLYHLVFVSKHKLGDQIWNSLMRVGPTGQQTLPGM
jgi:three-Cys-motif partner protein